MYPQTSINYVRHTAPTAGVAVAHLSIAPGPIL